MELRWRLAVVTGGAGVRGREVALALARRGAGVLVADPDAAAAAAVAAEARTARVAAWWVQADPRLDADRRLLVARSRDLGGADLVVTTGVPAGAAERLGRLVLADLADRPPRRGSPALLHVPDDPDDRTAARVVHALAGPANAVGARVLAVRPGGAAAQPSLGRTVVDQLAHGSSGAVVAAGHPPVD